MSLWDGDLGRLFSRLEHEFFGKMVATDVVMKVVIEVVVVEAVDVVRAGFFVFSRHGCLRMGVPAACVGTRGESVVSSGASESAADGGGVNGRIVAGSLMGFPESSGKTSHTVYY